MCIGLLWPCSLSGKGITLQKTNRALHAFYSVPALTLSEKESRCLALNVFFEARGESLAGKVGVAQVTLNRWQRKHRNKKSLCSVVFDPHQFSWTRSAWVTPTGSEWEQIKQIIQKVQQGLRIRGLENALYFHAKKKNPSWSRELVLLLQIGAHRYWALAETS